MSDELPRAHPNRTGLAATLAVAVSVLMAHHAMIASGFATVHGDLGDSRLQNFTLEHSYRALLLGQGDYWDPPFFHPEPNYTVRTDVLLTSAPLYWAARGVGLVEERAYQAWLMAMTVANALAMFLFLRRGLGVSPLAAAFGAVLFAAAGTRVARLYHPQLFVHAFTPLALWALCGVFRAEGAPEPRDRRRQLAVVAFPVAIVAQVYGAYYLGFFLVLALTVAAVVALVRRDSRQRLGAAIRENRTALAVAAVVSVVCAAPLLWHLRLAIADSGPRPYGSVLHAFPASFLNFGPGNVLYGWTHTWKMFELPVGHEQLLGLGLVTGAVGIHGLVRNRRRWGTIALIAGVVIPVLLATKFPVIGSGWRHVHRFFPGADGPNAIVRISLLLLIPIPIGVAWSLDALRLGRRGTLVALLVGALCLAEQLQRPAPGYRVDEAQRRRSELAARVAPQCAFFVLEPCGGDPAWAYQLDAMWAALMTGRPTLNGYSGAAPKGSPVVACRAAPLEPWLMARGLTVAEECLLSSSE